MALNNKKKICPQEKVEMTPLQLGYCAKFRLGYIEQNFGSDIEQNFGSDIEQNFGSDIEQNLKGYSWPGIQGFEPSFMSRATFTNHADSNSPRFHHSHPLLQNKLIIIVVIKHIYKI